MSRSVLYMSTSLDGFIAGPDDGPGNGLGDHGHRLHEWFADKAKADPVNRAVLAEAMATGAVVVGRRTFDLAGQWGGDHHDGVPIVVLTRRTADRSEWDNVTYLDDVRAAMSTAKTSPATRTSSSTVLLPPNSRSPRACSTRCNCMSSRCCSGRGGGCSMRVPRADRTRTLARRQASDVLHLRYRVRSAVR